MLKVPNMARVQDVEDAVGEDNGFACVMQAAGEGGGGGDRERPGRV
jgi:hypothetical protein